MQEYRYNNVILAMMQEEEDKLDKQYVLMTYRSHIDKKMPTTYYDTDTGWGCMLRVGQMAIANLLFLNQIIPFRTLLTLFWDNSDMPFSIQNFTLTTTKIYPHKQNFAWYNPCQMGFIVKSLLEEHFPQFNVKIFLNSSIFLEEIPTDKPQILVMIVIRLGLQKPEENYLPTVEDLMQSRFFFAAMGGTPRHAHLFLKVKEGQIGYLDPHKTNKAAATENELLERQNEYLADLSWISITKIDSSMTLIFKMTNQTTKQFWATLESIKSKHGQNFFIYMDQQRPIYSEDDGLIIIDDSSQSV